MAFTVLEDRCNQLLELVNTAWESINLTFPVNLQLYVHVLFHSPTRSENGYCLGPEDPLWSRRKWSKLWVNLKMYELRRNFTNVFRTLFTRHLIFVVLLLNHDLTGIFRPVLNGRASQRNIVSWAKTHRPIACVEKSLKIKAGSEFPFLFMAGPKKFGAEYSH